MKNNQKNITQIFNENINPNDPAFVKNFKKFKNSSIATCTTIMFLSTIMSFSLGMAIAEKKNFTEWIMYAVADVSSILYGVLYMFKRTAYKAALLHAAIETENMIQ